MIATAPVFDRGLAFARAVALHVRARTPAVVTLVAPGAAFDSVGLLDEATSAIDLEAEREILLHLREHPHRPTILITHRRDSVSMCDRLLEFRDGEIVADARPAPARSADQAR